MPGRGCRVRNTACRMVSRFWVGDEDTRDGLGFAGGNSLGQLLGGRRPSGDAEDGRGSCTHGFPSRSSVGIDGLGVIVVKQAPPSRRVGGMEDLNGREHWHPDGVRDPIPLL